jgi:DNA repair protein RAD51
LGLKAVVDKITYAHVPNSELLLDYANRLLPELLHKDPHVLVIVDSAVGPLRTEFSFKESRQRQAELQRLMGALKNLTKNFGVAVLVTNQVVMHPHAPDAFGRTEDIKPCGGNVMAHASQTRVEFKVPRGLRRSDERVAELVASPHMPVGEATFRITQGGLQ